MEQNFQVTKSEVFQKLEDYDKDKYKLFMITLLKLARNTKRIKKEISTIKNIELPHFIIVDKTGISETITYSFEENKWVIKSEKLNFLTDFNPTAITGVISFLNNFHFDDIQNGVELFLEEINELSLKYGINF
jgi:hypothetical protein